MNGGIVQNYVCIFFSAHSDIASVDSFPAANDLLALANANALIAKREAQFGYQLWQGSRKIADTRPVPRSVPSQFKNQNFSQQG